MSEIETILHYRLTDYEEAAFLLSRYFIQRGYQADLYRSRDTDGGYSALVSKHGFLKNLLGSRTAIEVTFYPARMPADRVLPTRDTLQNTAVTDESAKAMDTKPLPPSNKAVGGDSAQVYCCTGIRIRSGYVTDGIVKEFITYLTIIPALRKLGDFITMRSLAKKRSLIICDRLKKSTDGEGI